MSRLFALLLVIVLLSASTLPAIAQPTDPTPIDLVTWNIGLDDSDLETVGIRMAGFDGVDLWGLQEVNSRAAPAVLARAAAVGEDGDFAAIQGRAGDGLHLVAIYDADRFDLLDWWEIAEINTTGNVRPPLVLHLEERASGLQFLFMVNHLYRSRDAERHKQAALLAEWAAEQTLPVIAVGDYNFDWAIVGGSNDHDTGYDLMTEGDVWTWVRPDKLVTTQCSGWPCRYESVLDFVFAAGPAQRWRAESEIVVTADDFPDDTTTPDHRPVAATFWPAQASAGNQAIVNATANLRSGPGTTFAVTGRAKAGDALEVVGMNTDGSWLELAGGLWIAAFLVDAAPSGLGVVSEPVVVATPASGSRTADVEAAPAPAATLAPAPTAAPVEEPTATELPTAEAAPAGGTRKIIIETIFYDGAVRQVESDEYAVIANVGDGPVNLAGWRLNADDPGQDFTFPDVTLAPGQRVRVYTDEVHPETGGFSFFSDGAIWANKGECGHLYDAGGVEVSTWCY